MISKLKIDDLLRDVPFSDRGDPNYQRQRKLIQNLMDASRYLSPQLQNFCNYIIPLGSSPRRLLSVVPIEDAPQSS
jgi:hypothetical protein